MRIALPLLLAALGASTPARAEKTLTIGLPRPYGAHASVESGRIVSGALERELGVPVRARLFSTYEELADALARGTIDLANLTPIAYVRAAKAGQVIIVRRSLRNGLPYYRAVLFARKESRLQKLGDLKGKRIAWGPRWSASGSVLPRAAFVEQKLDLTKLFRAQIVLADHAEVCRAVFDGKVDVGSSFASDRPDLEEPVVDGCLPSFDGRLDELQIVYSSELIPNDVVAARPGFSTEMADRVGRVLDRLSETEQGRAVLRDGFRCDGYGTGSDSDFGPVRHALGVLKDDK